MCTHVLCLLKKLMYLKIFFACKSIKVHNNNIMLKRILRANRLNIVMNIIYLNN